MTVASDSSSMDSDAMANITESVSNNVRVVVRVRPPNALETNGQKKNVVEIMNQNVLVFDPKEQESPSFGRRGKRHRDIRKRRQKDMKFAFDCVFGVESSNAEIFEATTNCVLDGLLGGYNCSVFAYGATGAGKTYTMLGSESQPGVIYHTMIQLYRRIEDISQEKTCDVAVSYLEVYNEQIRDLLLPRGTLPIREDHNSGILIPGLSLHKPSSAEELLHMLQFGNKNRTQHPTDANAESSRSHAVFQVFVRQRERTANISAEVKVAKMCLVDLAGSERATVTKNRGARLREGANINRSLLALGNVINSLADQKYKGHIPYRDSKLTRLLKDSLGGNCRTIMIAAVSPSVLSYEDTYNTLKYADRAKNIRLDIKKNVLSVDFHISRYGKIVEDLRREIAGLKLKLEECEAPKVTPMLALAVPADVQALGDKLQSVYAARRSVRDLQLKQESSVRDTQWRLHRKQKCLQRTNQLSFAQPEMLHKIQTTIHGLQMKLMGQDSQRQSLSSQLLDNTHHLSQLQAQVLTPDTQSTAMAQLLELSIQKLGLEVELNDSRHYVRHLRRLARAQEREAMVSERLILALLRLVQRQQSELQRHGSVAADISDSYMHICNLVGECGVSWADEDESSEGIGQSPFHINSVIDIPLVSHTGFTENRVPSLTLPASHPSNLVPSSSAGMSNRLAPAIICPGRVINGQVIYSSPGSSLASQSFPAISLSAATRLQATVSSSSAFQQPDSTNASTYAKKMSAQPNSGAESDGMDGAGAGDLGKSPARSVFAGHTPAPKKAALNPTPCHADSGMSCALSGSKHTRNETFDGSRKHSLNETFSLEDEYRLQNTRNLARDSTAVLTVPTVPNVPIINSSLSPSACKVPRLGCVRTDTAYISHPQPFSVRPDNSLCSQNCNVLGEKGNLQEKSYNFSATQAQTSSKPGLSERTFTLSANTTLASSSRTAATVEAAAGVLRDASDINSGTVTKVAPAGERRVLSETVTKSWVSGEEDKENNDDQRQRSHVARAINFDGVVCSPRVEGRSYADAVKTPSPARLPLQSMDCNSPQVFANRLPSGPCQTPKGTGVGGGRPSLFITDPAALDNIRILKQFGMPSLVANLVMGKSAGMTSSVNSSQPSYMQPTKAVARRVRLQQKSFRDDSFQPKRIVKTLSHSRSKSASNLTRTGWKI